MSAGRPTSFGDIASSILDASLPAGPPILARRRGPEKRLAEAKAEEREAAAVQRAKRALGEQPHRDLRKPESASDPVLETNMRKIATRGVVQLFNAVRAAQRTDDDDGSAKPAKRGRREPKQGTGSRDAAADQPGGAPADLSKDSFLDILRRGTAAPQPANGRGRASAEVAPAAATNGAAGATGAGFLRDDFMIGRHRAKDWEREEEAEEEDGFVDGGAQGADDDDDDEP